jgi:integrase
MGSDHRGLEIRGNSIRIKFMFRGEQCRETLKIPPTRKNLEYAERKRAQILYEIEIGTFEYARHFPQSSGL